MSRSKRSFDRWKAHDPSTWSLQVFRKYNSELALIWDAHILSSRYSYSGLKAAGANWADLPSKHFDMTGVEWSKYPELKSWSDAFNLFDNWANLSAILTVASNLETYLASVISMALDSDPGLLLGASKSVDGAVVLKHGRPGAFQTSEQVVSCVKGDWSKRLDAFEMIFGRCPPQFRASHSDLEEIREIRNRFGHAFGRDIDAARLHGTLKTLPMEKLSRAKAQKLREVVLKVVLAVDKFLLKNHIGDFEAVRFYHHLYPSLHKHVPAGQRAIYLKKAIGKFGANPRGKVYCNGLVKYWEAL